MFLESVTIIHIWKVQIQSQTSRGNFVSVSTRKYKTCFCWITKQNKQFLQCKWHPHHPPPTPPDTDSLWKNFHSHQNHHFRSTRTQEINKHDQPQDVQAVVKPCMGRPRQLSKCAEKDLTQTLAASPGWQVDLQSDQERSLWKQPRRGTGWRPKWAEAHKEQNEDQWTWVLWRGSGITWTESLLRRPQHVFRTNTVRRNTDCCLQKSFSPYPDKQTRK